MPFPEGPAPLIPIGRGFLFRSPQDRNDAKTRGRMAAIVKALSRASRTEIEVETLKTIAMFCGVGLLVSLLFATYGLDLSAGFF
jgi:hypothetical protein